MKNTIRISVSTSLITLILLVSGCANSVSTGSMEEGELYNTVGLAAGSQLFDASGLAVEAYAEQAFIRTGFMWDAAEGCQLDGRFIDENGEWSDWLPMITRWSEGLAHSGYIDVRGQAAIGFQLRHVAGPAPSYLMAEAIDQIGEAAQASVATEQPEPGYKAMQQALAPSNMVHTRADWGARSPACNSGSHSPSKITIHHTASPLPDSVSVITRLRQVQNYHIDTRGWCDVGYHYLVDWNGEIWQGRYETTIGAHVLDNNTGNVGISFIGTYNSSSPTSAQINNTAGLMSWLHNQYGIAMTRTKVKGHREYRGNSAGDCPGDRLYAKLGDLVTLAAGGSVDPGDDPGDDPVGSGLIQGVVFLDQGQGTSDMSWRLPGATVSVSGHGSTAARASDAYWSVGVPAGSYTVTASMSGYQTASRTCSVSDGSQVWCSIGLVPGDDPGDDPGQDPGDDPGQDPGDDPGQDPGDDPGQDPGDDHEGQGKVFGHVLVGIEKKFVNDPELGDPVAGAKIMIYAEIIMTETDQDGYFEAWVDPGTYDIAALAEGFMAGGNECEVVEGGETECEILVIPDSHDLAPGDPDDTDPELYPGCSTAGHTPSAAALFLVLVFGLVYRRKRDN